MSEMSLETKVVKSRLGLLSLAEELGNVSRACKYLGYSRETLLLLQRFIRRWRRTSAQRYESTSS